MMRWFFASVVGMALCSCTGTETGNPHHDSRGSLALRLVGTESNALRITLARMSLDGIHFVPAGECDGDHPTSGVEVATPDEVQLTENEAFVLPLALPTGDYCAVRLDFDAPMGEAAAVVLQGADAQGQPVVRQSVAMETVELKATDGGFAFDAEHGALLLAFDVAAWLRQTAAEFAIAPGVGLYPDPTGDGTFDQAAPPQALATPSTASGAVSPVTTTAVTSSRSVLQITAGYEHTCALLADGAVRCWGRNNLGQLGYGHTNNLGDDEPAALGGDVPLGGIAVQIDAGESHTCALLDNGKVRCWGAGSFGRLGYANQANVGATDTPASVGDVNLGRLAVQVDAGGLHSCALLDDASVRCWGRNDVGQLGANNGDRDIGDDETPSSGLAVAVGGDVLRLASGYDVTCALLVGGKVRCWGRSASGTLGHPGIGIIGDTTDPSDFGDVDVGADIKKLSVGTHACAITQSDDLRCWGFNDLGALGLGNTLYVGDDEPPSVAPNVSVGGKVKQVATTEILNSTCTLLSEGGVRCWGENSRGQLGYGHTRTIGDDELPSSEDLVQLGGSAVHVAVGFRHACAVLLDGTLRCWGHNDVGQLGYGHTRNIGDDETPASAGAVPVGP